MRYIHSRSRPVRYRNLTFIAPAYTDVCDQPIPEQQLATFQDATAHTREASSPTSEPALTECEADNTRCLFGLRDVAEIRYQWMQFTRTTGLQPGLRQRPVSSLFVSPRIESPNVPARSKHTHRFNSLHRSSLPM